MDSFLSIPSRFARKVHFQLIRRKYRRFTMVKPREFIANLQVAYGQQEVGGCVVECGAWRGGMIAGIAEIFGPSRHYYLFDSFQGQPPPTQTAGQSANGRSQDARDANHRSNGVAKESEARATMALARVNFTITPGWFAETLPSFRPSEPISLLRLDAEWYDSTMTCLTHLYPLMAKGGLIVLADYHTSDGCSCAVHDFLSQTRYAARISDRHGSAAIRVNFRKVPNS
jgi:hypothetical protein